MQKVFLVLCLVLFAHAGSFWQFTDPHEDHKYIVGSDPQARCQSGHGGAGKYGDFWCDMPHSTITSALQSMKITQGRPDFILWTGDMVAHKSEWATHEAYADFYKNVSLDMAQAFPNVPVFPVVGNNDVSDEMVVGPNWQYETLSNVWSQTVPFLNSAAAREFKTCGYYSQMIRPGLRMVVLNTVIYLNGEDAEDPCGQFAWLTSTLKLAESSHEKVYMSYHVPLGQNERNGNPYMDEKRLSMLLAIFSKYSSIIVLHFGGHSHSDTFKLLSSKYEDGHPFGCLLVSPGPDVYCGEKEEKCNNPSVRLYTYDSSSFEVSNYKQYWADLKEANAKGQISWKLEYDFAEIYGASSITTESMYGVHEKLTYDEDLFEKYHSFHKVKYPHEECGKKCKAKHLCAIRYSRFNEFSDCYALSD